MKTTIYYNGVIIKDVLTESITHVAVKESTGVDQLGVEVTVSVTGVVHSANTDTIGVKASSPFAFTQGLSGILARLTKDRRQFQMKIGGTFLYDVVPGAIEPGFDGFLQQTGRLMDIDNGPRPQVEVLQILSGVAAKIRFTLRFIITNCGGGGNLNRNGLLFFRFWVAENVNCRTWLTTRRFQGMIRVAHTNISPHALARTVTIPPLEDGFVRRLITWDESPNGLELAFVIEDEEVVATPPYNAFTLSGASAWTGHLVHSTDTLGATSIIEASVRLEGPKSVSVLDLAELAQLVITQKIQYRTLVKGGSAYFLDFSISEQLDENIIDCSCKIRHTGKAADFVGLFNLGQSPVIGQPMGDLGVGYDSNVAIQFQPTAGTNTLFRALLQVACSPNSFPAIKTAPKIPKSKLERKESQPVQESPGELLQEPVNVSPEHEENLYFDYRLESDYRFDSGKIALASGLGSDSTGPTQQVVNLYLPRCQRQVRIIASRLDAPPQLPEFRSDFVDLIGINNRRIGEAILAPVAPQLSADGRHLLYEVHLQAEYAMDRPPTPGERIAVGALPYRSVRNDDASRSLPPAIFLPAEFILS